MVDIKLTSRQSVMVSIKNNKSIADSMVEDYLWFYIYYWSGKDIWYECAIQIRSAAEQIIGDFRGLEDRSQQLGILHIFFTHLLDRIEEAPVLFFELVKTLPQNGLRKHQLRSFVRNVLHLLVLLLEGSHVQQVDVLPDSPQHSLCVQVQSLIL